MSVAALPSPLSLPAPLPAEQADLLARLTDGLDTPRLWWLSGYAAGLAQRGANSANLSVVPVADAAAAPVITVVYGSQTGNAKRFAESLAQRIETSGQPARLLRADAYPLRALKDERHLLLVISTQGDGDPPDDARGFVKHLLGRRAPALPELKFAVLGLGDSSYPKFCEIGRRLDARLAELGATRWFDRADADVDIEAVAAPWIERAVALAEKLCAKPAAPLATVTPLRPASSLHSWSREKPFAAELLTNQRITGRGSARDVWHLELSLQGSGLTYEPGDALGVWPTNPLELVAAILSALRLDADESVTHSGRTLPLREWLATQREITRLGRPFLAAHAQRANAASLRELLREDARERLAIALSDWQPLDLLQAHPAAWSADELIAALRPLAPRLYSIASSMKSVGEEAHLCVARLSYERDGQLRWGAASHFLASRGEGERAPVFIERNERFRLPADPARDIVMIGAGAGIAPFRGFVQEREAVGANGRNWLLFGARTHRDDFLYQTEWQQALKHGCLHRLDLAFSRDGATKIHVQDRLREHGRTLYAWIEGGAHLYVCGAVAMGKGVHAALLDTLTTHAGMDAETAQSYLGELQRQGRYARDVY